MLTINQNANLKKKNYDHLKELLKKISGIFLLVVILLPGFHQVFAQSQSPVIAGINPTAATAGGPAFVLTITGTRFNRFSVVKWNGAARSTNLISGSQLLVSISAADIAAPGVANISVFNGNSNTESNLWSFSINGTTPPPPPPPPVVTPVITAMNPPSATAGTRHFKLIVMGRGFDSASAVQWNGSNRPTTYINSTQLLANIPATDIKAPGAAQVKVVNADGAQSNVQPFSIQASTTPPQALSQPLLTGVVSNVVAQGARRIRLTVTGSNFKEGARLFISSSQNAEEFKQTPDIAIESYQRINENLLVAVINVSDSANMGLRSVNVINNDGTNTGIHGSHTSKLLRIESSHSLAAPLAVNSLVVTHPRNGSVAAQGEELFAQALLGGQGTGTVTGQWLLDGNVFEHFTVNVTGGERVALKTTRSLPTYFLGQHKLELRITSPNELQTKAIEIVINPGNWQLMRLLAPAAKSVFAPDAPPLLSWAIVPGAAKYRIGFSSEPFFRSIEKWYDVTDTRWQIPQEIWNDLATGEIYWTVRAVESSGDMRQPALMRRIFRGQTNAANTATNSKASLNATDSSANSSKMIKQANPLIEEKNKNSAKVKAELSVTDAEPESPVNDPSSAQAGNSQTTDAPTNGSQNLEASVEGAKADSPFNFEFASNTQAVSGSVGEIAVLSVAGQASLQRGAWRFEMNGSGTANALLSARPRQFLGRFDDYIFHAAHEKKEFGADLRFGILTPAMYTNAEFINTQFPQQGFEGALRTQAGTLAFYTNAHSRAAGEGVGFDFRQHVQGASYEAPLPKERATLRLMWLHSQDLADAQAFIADDLANGFMGLTMPKKTDALGGLLLVAINKQLNWTTEYAVTSQKWKAPFYQANQGRAFRTGISGVWKRTQLNLAFREVTPNYATAAGAALGQFSSSDRRGMDSSLIQQTAMGMWTVNYQFLQSDVRSKMHPTTSLHNLTINWAKNLNKHTILALGVNTARTRSDIWQNSEFAGEGDPFFVAANHLRKGFNASLTENFSKFNFTITGSRNWFRDKANSAQSNIISSINLNTNWTPQSFFQLQSSFSINWFAGDKVQVGGNRVMIAYLQPAFTWQATGLSLIPLLTANYMKAKFAEGIVTNDTLNLNYGGRVSWRAPGRFQFNTFSVETGRTSFINRLSANTISTPRLLFLWTIVQPGKLEN
jgi:hypothetical protein